MLMAQYIGHQYNVIDIFLQKQRLGRKFREIFWCFISQTQDTKNHILKLINCINTHLICLFLELPYLERNAFKAFFAQ